MPIVVKCTCGKKLRAADEFAGKTAKCPSCGRAILVEGEPVAAHDVFISYSSQDKVTADAVCAVLEARGIRCWVAPRDILPGTEWGEAIVEAIAQTRIMVLIFSSYANDSQQVRREVERAVGHGRPIIPFRIEDVKPSKSMEYFLGTPHWLDALTEPMEEHIDSLSKTVSALLSRPQGAAKARRRAETPSVLDLGDLPAAPLLSPHPKRKSPAHKQKLLLGGAGAAGVLLIAVVLGLIFGGGGADDSSRGPDGGSSVALVEAKSRATVAWNELKEADGSYGISSLIHELEVAYRTAEEHYGKGAHEKAAKGYQDVEDRCKSIHQRIEARDKALPVRKQAHDAVKALDEIDESHGLDIRIDDATAKLRAADDAMEGAQYEQAEKRYTEVAALCDTTLDSSKARDAALAAKEAAAEAQQIAHGNAKQVDEVKETIEAADAEMRRAAETFEAGDFAAAQAAWKSAETKYGEVKTRVMHLATAALADLNRELEQYDLKVLEAKAGPELAAFMGPFNEASIDVEVRDWGKAYVSLQEARKLLARAAAAAGVVKKARPSTPADDRKAEDRYWGFVAGFMVMEDWTCVRLLEQITTPSSEPPEDIARKVAVTRRIWGDVLRSASKELGLPDDTWDELASITNDTDKHSQAREAIEKTLKDKCDPEATMGWIAGILYGQMLVILDWTVDRSHDDKSRFAETKRLAEKQMGDLVSYARFAGLPEELASLVETMKSQVERAQDGDAIQACLDRLENKVLDEYIKDRKGLKLFVSAKAQDTAK